MHSTLFSRIIQKIKEGDDRCCRICADTVVELDDKWIHPCGCKGSMLWVHHHCLKKWMEYSNSTKCTTCGYSYKIQTIQSNSTFSFLFHPFFIKSLSIYLIGFLYYCFYLISSAYHQKNKKYFFHWFYILRGISILSILFYVAIYFLSTKLKIELPDDPYEMLEDESLLFTSFVKIPKFLFSIFQNLFQKKTDSTIEILDY